MGPIRQGRIAPTPTGYLSGAGRPRFYEARCCRFPLMAAGSARAVTASARYSEMSRIRKVPVAALRRLTRQMGHIGTQSGATVGPRAHAHAHRPRRQHCEAPLRHVAAPSCGLPALLPARRTRGPGTLATRRHARSAGAGRPLLVGVVGPPAAQVPGKLTTLRLAGVRPPSEATWLVQSAGPVIAGRRHRDIHYRALSKPRRPAAFIAGLRSSTSLRCAD